MEALYAKLYDSFTKLKTKKFGELEEVAKDTEEKFLEYLSAAESLIDHLRNEKERLVEEVADLKSVRRENERLQREVGDLKSEVVSIRSQMEEEKVEYEKLLMEENQKSVVLSKEVERLQKLEQQGLICYSINGRKDTGQRETPGDSNGKSDRYTNSSSAETTKKRRRRQSLEGSGGIVTPQPDHDDAVEMVSKDLPSITLPPQCCRTDINPSGGSQSNTISARCLYQALIEYLVGMKLSAVNQTDEKCVTVVHESSGYSFSLKWVEKADGQEPELLYNVLSLGTLERTMPVWLTDEIMFSHSMCSLFFEKVLKVIKRAG